MLFYIACVAVILLLSFAFVCIYHLLKPEKPDKREIALANLAKLWVPEKQDIPLKTKETSIQDTHQEEGDSKTSEEKEKAHQTTWIHPDIVEFYDQHVKPYAKILAHGGFLKSIEQILRLLDQYGQCPSVVQDHMDKEYESLQSVYDILATVSLLEHSLNTAREMVTIVRKAGGKDYEFSLGKILIAALGHDLGKIPKFHKVSYSTGDHAIISHAVLDGMLPADLPGRGEILKAVRDHHFKTKEGFTALLREADQQARSKEIKQKSTEAALSFEEVTREGEVKEEKTSGQPELIDLSWLDLTVLLDEIEEKINIIDEKGWFSAISMRDGLVYVMPALISDLVIRLAEKKGHKEILIYEKDKEKRRNLEYTVATMLKEKGLIPDFIGDGYTGARFVLLDRAGNKFRKGFYTPIKVEAFKSSLSELEARKEESSKLKKIATIKPVFE